MLRGELCRWYPPDAAVRSGLVVVTSPARDLASGIGETREPVLVETFVPEAAIEAFNVGVLCQAARLNQNVFDLVRLCPSEKGSRGELRSVVGSDGFRVTAKLRCLVKQACDVARAHAEVHRDLHALATEIIDYRQAFDPSSCRQAVADKVHAPGLIEGLGRYQRHTLSETTRLGFASNCESRLAVEPVDAFVINPRLGRAQQIVNHPVARSPSDVRDFDDVCSESLIHFTRQRRVSIAVAGEPHQCAGAAFRQLLLHDHRRNRFAFHWWG